MPCGEKCCCILGGCGCSAGGQEQLRALSELIEKAATPEKAAREILDIFGEGPHVKRLKHFGQTVE